MKPFQLTAILASLAISSPDLGAQTIARFEDSGGVELHVSFRLAAGVEQLDVTVAARQPTVESTGLVTINGDRTQVTYKDWSFSADPFPSNANFLDRVVGDDFFLSVDPDHLELALPGSHHCPLVEIGGQRFQTVDCSLSEEFVPSKITGSWSISNIVETVSGRFEIEVEWKDGAWDDFDLNRVRPFMRDYFLFSPANGVIFDGLVDSVPMQLTLLGVSGHAELGPLTLDYTDGRSHSLEGDVDGRVIVTNGSHLDFRGRITSHRGPALVVDDATATVNGGFIREQDGAVHITNGATMTLNAGALADTVSVIDATLIVNGGFMSADGETALSGAGSSKIIMDSGLVSDSLRYGVALADTTSFTLRDGIVQGGAAGVIATGLSSVRMSGGRIGSSADRSSYGAVLHDHATVRLSAGTIRSSSSDGHALVFSVNDHSSLDIRDGDFTTWGTGGTTFIVASGDSRTTVHGGRYEQEFTDGSFRFVTARDSAVVEVFSATGDSHSDNSSFDQHFFATENEARMVLHGGQFTARLWDDQGATPIFLAKDASRLEVRGGVYLAAVGGNRVHEINVVETEGSAEIAIHSGHFSVRSADDPANLVRVVLASGESRAEILGGRFNLSTPGDSTARHLEAVDQATITVHGSEFNYPLFTPIEASEGTIRGTLADGNQIAWAFRRDPTATILLVPEPSTATLSLFVLAAVWWRRRHA